MRAMTLRLPDEVHEALRREAFDSRRSMNEVVLEALGTTESVRALLKLGMADAWDEGASDGAWNHEHEAMIERGNLTAITNPYREGSK